MAVTWRKPENVVKQKKIKPSVKKKIKAEKAAKDAAEAAGVPYVPSRGRKNKKRKRDDEPTEAADGEVEHRPKKQTKKAKLANSALAQEIAAMSNGDTAAVAEAVKDMPLQDLAFVDTAGTGIEGANVNKHGVGPRKQKNKPVRKQKLLPKKERKELKKLKKMGLAKGQTAASIMAEREPEKKEDTRKVRKQRRLLRKKGLFAELAEFEKQVAADKEMKRQKELAEAAAAEAAEAQEKADALAGIAASQGAVTETVVEQVVETKADPMAKTIVETVSETKVDTVVPEVNGDLQTQKKKKKSKKSAKSTDDITTAPILDETTNGEIEAKQEPEEQGSQKKKKNSKKSSKSEDSAVTGEQVAENTTNGDTIASGQAGGDVEPQASSKRKREPLADPVIPQKEHRFIVFVGNLPFSATKDEVQKHFKAVYPVNVRLMTDKETGKSRGFAFVEFDRYDYMKSCLSKYHHSHFRPGTEESRRINVELTVGGGGTSEERKNKIKDKNQKLRHEQFRRRERVKDEEYQQKQLEKAEMSADKAKGVSESRNGVHPSRMHRVKQ